MEWNIAQIARYNAQKRPGEMALQYDGEGINYQHLEERSNQVAQGLIALGLQPGDRVALLARNCPEQFYVLIGAAKAGVVTVPVNWRLAPREVGYILEDAEARVLFVDATFLESIDAVRSGLSDLNATLVIGNGERGDAFDDWCARHGDEDPRRDQTREEAALQLYTSGTTGLPKGVLLSARNLFTLLDRSGPLWGLNEVSTSLVCLPLFHIGGIGWAMACMRFGGTVLLRDFEPAAVLEDIDRHRVTHANFVPAMLAAMVDAAHGQTHDLSSLELIVYGTAPIAPELLARAMATFGCDFAQLYGLTETTSAITQLDPEDHRRTDRTDVLSSAGRPYPWVETRIVDPVTGEPCSPREPGELWVRSEQNMLGYWHRPEATAETITVDGWLRTGDAGFIREDGYVFLTDRVKDMIVSGGENVYPAEVEAVLAEHPSVRESAVIGVPDDRWGESVKALVVCQGDAAATEAELIEWTRSRLAHYKCPRSVAFIDALPRTATGKVLKRTLREPYWEGQQRSIH